MSTQARLRYKQFEFDKLQMYFGKIYTIDFDETPGQIRLKVPCIGDIISIGESKFYQTLNIFITNTTSYRLPLWEIGIDWNETSDFELFTMLYKGIDKDVSDLLFDGIDFSKFELLAGEQDGETKYFLCDMENEIVIDEIIYQHIAQYFRKVFSIQPEEKLTDDPMLKDMFIMKDKNQIRNDEIKRKKGKQKESDSIQAVISSCINHPGFKYKLDELVNVNVCMFYDSVKRLQIYENSTALLKGMYSGFIDGKSIDPDNYNFMKNI